MTSLWHTIWFDKYTKIDNFLSFFSFFFTFSVIFGINVPFSEEDEMCVRLESSKAFFCSLCLSSHFLLSPSYATALFVWFFRQFKAQQQNPTPPNCHSQSMFSLEISFFHQRRWFWCTLRGNELFKRLRCSLAIWPLGRTFAYMLMATSLRRNS